jgi:hypothetical protein
MIRRAFLLFGAGNHHGAATWAFAEVTLPSARDTPITQPTRAKESKR